MGKKKEEAMDEYLSTHDVAETFKVPLRQVRLAIRSGELKAARVGRFFTISKKAVLVWLQGKTS